MCLHVCGVGKKRETGVSVKRKEKEPEYGDHRPRSLYILLGCKGERGSLGGDVSLIFFV